MASEPPPELVEFYNLISTTTLEELIDRDYVVDPRPPARSGPRSSRPRQLNPSERILHNAIPEGTQLFKNYWKLQEALFDFRGGYCLMCHLPPAMRHSQKKHAHSCQGTGVAVVKEMPGLLVYANLLQEKIVHMKLADEMLLFPDHDFLKGQRSPVTVTEDSAKVAPLPDAVASLLGSVLELGDSHATLQLSRSDALLSLSKDSSDSDRVVHVHIGCDAVLVLGLEERDLESALQDSTNRKAESPPVGKFGWDELIVSSDDERYDGPRPKRQKRADPAATSKAAPSSTKSPGAHGHLTNNPSARGQLGILLRAGDVVSMTGPARRAWRGIAKVMPGSSPAWEQEWPCWGERSGDEAFEAFKGCMESTAVSLSIR